MQTPWQDLRYGVRALLKNPGFIGRGHYARLGHRREHGDLQRRQRRSAEAASLRRDKALWPSNRSIRKRDARYGAPPADFWDWQEQSRTFEKLAMYSGGGIGLKESERISHFRRKSDGKFLRYVRRCNRCWGAHLSMKKDFEQPAGDYSQSPPLAKPIRRDPQIVGHDQDRRRSGSFVIGVMAPDFKFPELCPGLDADRARQR